VARVRPHRSGARPLEGGVSAEAVAQQHTNLRFKNVDAIGHPLAGLLYRVRPVGALVKSAARPFVPYFIRRSIPRPGALGSERPFRGAIPVCEISGALGPLGTWAVSIRAPV
jgi:hypothetical protein